MGRFFAIVGIVGVAAMVGNLTAQRMLPARVDDRLHRRMGYSILVRVIVAASLVGLAYLASLIAN